MSILTQDQLCFVGVKALFINKKGECLVLKRDIDYKTTPYRSWYDLPGGKNQALESTQETLIRELREELGMQPSDFTVQKQLGCFKTDVSFNYLDRIVALFLIIFVCKLRDENMPIVLVDPANKSCEWMDMPHMQDAFAKYSPEFMCQLGSLVIS